MQKHYLVIGLIMALTMPAIVQNFAFAQYGQAGNTPTLEQDLKVAKERITLVQKNPGVGSGTPLLSAGGMLTAIILAGAVFGTIFILFVVYAKRITDARKH